MSDFVHAQTKIYFVIILWMCKIEIVCKVL